MRSPHRSGLLVTASLLPLLLSGSCGDAEPAPSRPAAASGNIDAAAPAASRVRPSEARLREAAAHAERGEIRAAADAYREATRLDPENAEAHLWLGRTLMALSRTSAGRGGDAIGADGGVKLGQDMAKLREAVTELQRASELSPEDAGTLYWLGRALHVADRTDEALAALDRAVALAPNHGAAWKRIGLICLETGDVERAREALEKAEPLLPEDPGIAFQLGNVLAEEYPEAARDAYRRALEVDPTFSAAYNGLAGVLGRLGDEEGARGARADFERWRGFMDRTRAVAARANRAQDDAALQLKAGEMYLAHRAWTQALEYFDRALALDGSNPQIHIYCGIAARGAGNLERARMHLEEALYLAPAALEVRLELIGLLVEQGDEARLREVVDETSAAANSMDPAARGGYARALADLGLVADARVQWEAILAADPTQADAQEALASLASEEKDAE